MAIRTKFLLATTAVALAVSAPSALAQDLPEARTHVDPAESSAVQAGTPDPDAPILETIKSRTTLASIRQGYLQVLLRCDADCVVDVSAHAKKNGKFRRIAVTRKRLRGGKTYKVKLRITTAVRKQVRNGGLKYEFRADPHAVGS